jgi:hypothetical protein
MMRNTQGNNEDMKKKRERKRKRNKWKFNEKHEKFQGDLQKLCKWEHESFVLNSDC